jgi:LDH2 family malate/lactate/ureidoglycolate dehydrogenase
MNLPPVDFIRVPHQNLHAFVARACTAVGMPQDKADLLADLLTANDLRGVFSHGTTQIATYARLMRDGILNPRPVPQIGEESPFSLVMDGDGGLGYFPAYANALGVIERAKTRGIAVGLTRNHGHFGAAGIYSRLTLPHDLLTFVTSGHQLTLVPGAPIYAAAGGSPMSFSAPAAKEQSLVLDFGAMHDLYADSPHRDEMARLAPGIVFRSIGLGAICQAWGGFLAGVPLDPARAQRTWAGANQGSLLIAFRIDLFIPAPAFKAEMDAYIAAVRELQPLPGFDASVLPGGVEAARAEEYRAQGVPVGPEHRSRLEGLAAELSIAPPW